MKNLKRILTTVVFVFAISALSAQTPPPPNGGSSPTGSNTPVGGGAPLSSGLIILAALGAAYGGKKVYEFKNKQK